MKTLFTILVTLFLAAPGFAQTISPEELHRRVSSIRNLVTPEVATYLEDPQTLYVIAGLQPEYIVIDERIQSDQFLAPKIAKALGNDIGVSVEDSSATFRSLSALRQNSGGSDAKMFTQFPAQGSLSTWDDWSSEQREVLSKKYPDSAAVLMIDFMAGAPPFTAQSTVAREADPVADDRSLEVNMPYDGLIDGAGISFYILPEYVGKDTFQEWVSDRQKLLDGYYQLPEVKARMQSQAWIDLRAAARPGTAAKREMWLQKRSQDAIDTPFERLSSDDELVLVKHSQELANIIRSGAYPDKWLDALLKWSADAGLSPAISSDTLKSWMWWGAYGNSEARGNLYSAISEVAPNYFSNVSKKNIEDWLEFDRGKENAVPDDYDKNRALILFSHPEIKKAYQAMSDSDKEILNDRLRAYLVGEATAPLLRGAPYNLN